MKILLIIALTIICVSLCDIKASLRELIEIKKKPVIDKDISQDAQN